MKLIKGYYLNEQRMDLKINLTRRANSLSVAVFIGLPNLIREQGKKINRT